MVDIGQFESGGERGVDFVIGIMGFTCDEFLRGKSNLRFSEKVKGRPHL